VLVTVTDRWGLGTTNSSKDLFKRVEVRGAGLVTNSDDRSGRAVSPESHRGHFGEVSQLALDDSILAALVLQR
jgi:hypothetical protein